MQLTNKKKKHDDIILIYLWRAKAKLTFLKQRLWKSTLQSWATTFTSTLQKKDMLVIVKQFYQEEVDRQEDW
jgi:hypothetical protein